MGRTRNGKRPASQPIAQFPSSCRPDSELQSEDDKKGRERKAKVSDATREDFESSKRRATHSIQVRHSLEIQHDRSNEILRRLPILSLRQSLLLRESLLAPSVGSSIVPRSVSDLSRSESLSSTSVGFDVVDESRVVVGGVRVEETLLADRRGRRRERKTRELERSKGERREEKEGRDDEQSVDHNSLGRSLDLDAGVGERVGGSVERNVDSGSEEREEGDVISFRRHSFDKLDRKTELTP